MIPIWNRIDPAGITKRFHLVQEGLVFPAFQSGNGAGLFHVIIGIRDDKGFAIDLIGIGTHALHGDAEPFHNLIVAHGEVSIGEEMHRCTGLFVDEASVSTRTEEAVIGFLKDRIAGQSDLIGVDALDGDGGKLAGFPHVETHRLALGQGDEDGNDATELGK